MFRGRNFTFTSEIDQVSIESVICRLELSVSNDTEIYVFFLGQHELLSLNYDCKICRRVSELRRKIYAKYLRALIL